MRQAFDALARDDAGLLPARPSLAAVNTPVATYGGAHPGVVLADFGCNHLYGRIRDAADAPLAELFPRLLAGTSALVLPRNALPRLRQLDRSLRRVPPSLADAGREVALLRDHARGGTSVLSTVRAAREGAAAAAAEIWALGLDRLARAEPAALATMARNLAGQAEAQLATKSGHYEGLWLALEGGWSGFSTLADRTRASLDDRELAARLWRLTLEAANHRGDVASAAQACVAFDAVLDGGQSLALLAERLVVRNLAAVAEQNALPYREGVDSVTPETLAQGADRLVDAADLAATLLDLERGGPSPVPRAEPEADERRLWEAAGAPVRREAPDRERGRMYGTAARSLAFAGRLQEAQALALKARSLFADPFDLRFNSAVLARIEIERSRLDPAHPTSLLRAALDDLGWSRQRKPADAKRALRADPAHRFLLDLVLRTMLWAKAAIDVPEAKWAEALQATDPESLYAILSAGSLRSHPTELIARHAGELARRHGAHDAGEQWFRLSTALSAESADGAIRRFGEMTAALARDEAFAGSGPPGSLLNPTFEYR